MGRAWVLVVLSSVLLVSCGGQQSAVNQPPPNPGPAPSPGGGELRDPIVISVSGGLNVAGVDITVVAPASSSAPNAEVLGVSQASEAGTASNTGAVIRRGTTRRVLLFGRNLSGARDVTITGPQDITIANVQAITSASDLPGISFDATVASGAALGARTVILRATNNDVTTFTGGLEVVP